MQSLGKGSSARSCMASSASERTWSSSAARSLLADRRSLTCHSPAGLSAIFLQHFLEGDCFVAFFAEPAFADDPVGLVYGDVVVVGREGPLSAGEVGLLDRHWRQCVPVVCASARLGA